MKRILKSFPLFLCVIMVTVFSCIPANAYVIDEDTGRVIWSEEDLIQFGMVKDPDGTCYFPSGTWDPDILYSQNLLFTNEKYYPNFDLMKLPWESFPQPVKDILSMSLDGYSVIDSANFKIPFVLIRVSYGTTITVYVGTNLGIGRRLNAQTNKYDDMIRICTDQTRSTFSNCVCYMAQYRLSDYSIMTNWSQLQPINWGDNGRTVYFDSTIALKDKQFDMYIYGGLGVKASDDNSLRYPLTLDESYYVVFWNGGRVGYQNLLLFPDSGDYKSYLAWFYPPTDDDVAAHRQQQIINVTGNANTMTTVDSSSVDDYYNKEEELVSKYDPDNLTTDVKVEFDSKASSYIWDLITKIVKADASVFGFVISALSLGVISLILNR